MALSKQSTYTSDVATTSLITPENSRKISMGVNPKTMRFLIDRLTDMYPEPVISSVREVISNAIDATMQVPEADRKAVEILSPGTFNPVFIVTDHGVGMSVQDIEELFSQYGGSEKMDDFTQLGAYGLGAKAPLAYCNQFNVETTKDGITTRFTVSRESIGNTTEIYFSEETGKPAGTTVSIPVKTGDEHKFDKALDNYRKFQADVPITLDGKLVEQTLDYGLFDTVELDSETGLVGRVWVKRDNFPEIVTSYISQLNSKHSIGFLLSGWIYKGRHNGYGGDHDFLVELKPGVVDFSSSRDAITQNERFEALMKRIDESLGSINERLLEKVMEYYRGLDNRAAWELYNIMSLTQEGKKVFLEVSNNNYYGYNRANTKPQKFALSIDDFTTDSGFNPVKTVLESKPKTVYGKVYLTGEDGKDYDFFQVEEAKGDRANMMNYRYRYHNTLSRFKRVEDQRSTRRTFGEVSSDIRTAVEDRVTVALTDLYFGVPEFSNDESRSAGPLVFVTGVNVDFVDEFVKRRLSVARHLYKNRILIFAESEPSAEEQELVSSVYGVEFTSITADEFRKKATDAHKAALAARKAEAPEERPILATLVYEFGDEIGSLHNARQYSSQGAHLVSDIISDGDVLIGAKDGGYDRVVMGAINQGADFTNKKVYISRHPMDWLAQHFVLLADYENVFFDHSFNNRSKAAQPVLARGRRDSSFLLSEIKDVSLNEIIYLYLSENHMYPSGQGKEFWTALRENTENKELKKTYRRLAAANRSNSHRSYYDMGRELLTARLPKREARALMTVVEVVSSLSRGSGSDFAGQIYSVLATAHVSDDDREIYDFLITRYAKRLEEKVIAKLEENEAEATEATQ